MPLLLAIQCIHTDLTLSSMTALGTSDLDISSGNLQPSQEEQLRKTSDIQQWLHTYRCYESVTFTGVAIGEI